MSFEQLNYYQAKLSFEMDSSDVYTALNNNEDIIIVDGRSATHISKSIFLVL